MPTNKQERERARRNLQQQLERRREAEARRRKTMIAVTVVATVAVIGVVLALVIGLAGGSSDTPAAAGSGSASASPSTSGAGSTTGPCAYTATPQGDNPNVVDVGLPPDPDPTPTETRTLSFTTNLGALTIELDSAAAPCNAQSIGFLAQTGFYNGTSCHRLVTEGIFVLQCGDPSGTGSGGPAYQTKDENLSAANYAEGVVAMANSGANTNSSQFFIMTADSNAGLQKNYTVIGKVTAGLDLVKQVAAAGTEDGQSDGKPKQPLTFDTATLTPPLEIPSAGASASDSAPAVEPSATDSAAATGTPSQ